MTLYSSLFQVIEIYFLEWFPIRSEDDRNNYA